MADFMVLERSEIGRLALAFREVEPLPVFICEPDLGLHLNAQPLLLVLFDCQLTGFPPLIQGSDSRFGQSGACLQLQLLDGIRRNGKLRDKELRCPVRHGCAQGNQLDQALTL